MNTVALSGPGGCEMCRHRDVCDLYKGKPGGSCYLLTMATDPGHNREPRLVTHGVDPRMTNHHHSKANGESKALVPAIKQIIAEARVGWVVFTLVASGIMHLAASLIMNGWIISPAKSSDMIALTVIVREMGESIKQLNPAMVRLSEDVRGLNLRQESTDRKIDRLLDRPSYPVTVPTVTPEEKQPSPSSTPRRAHRQLRRTGVFGIGGL